MPRSKSIQTDHPPLKEQVETLTARVKELEALINNPIINDFIKGVQTEQAHQMERWGTQEEYDPSHFMLVCNKLLGKMAVDIFDEDLDKFKHHIIALAAVQAQLHRLCLQIGWHGYYFTEKKPQ